MAEDKKFDADNPSKPWKVGELSEEKLREVIRLKDADTNEHIKQIQEDLISSNLEKINNGVEHWLASLFPPEVWRILRLREEALVDGNAVEVQRQEKDFLSAMGFEYFKLGKMIAEKELELLTLVLKELRANVERTIKKQKAASGKSKGNPKTKDLS